MAKHDGIRFGPLDGHTAHLCVDMQRLFAEDTPWHTPWMERVLPVVARIVDRHPAETIFTRFVPPHQAEELPGGWRRYYRRWSEMTLERLDPELLDLASPLAQFVPPATVIDKRVYSPFSDAALWRLLHQRRVENLVITGGETDVCVLAAVLDAVDQGYRVVLAEDALCSSADETHDALMKLYRNRFTEQIELAESEAILAAWN